MHDEFPGLVSAAGKGWFCTHVHKVADHILKNPDKVREANQDKAKAIKSGFDTEWRKRFVQLQTPLFDPSTKGAWVLKIENIIAEALEAGPLRKQKVVISDGLNERLRSAAEGKVPDDVLGTLIGYYIANRQEDTEWVVLPVSSFDAWFGTSFGRRWLRLIPETVIERSSQSFGVSRYLIRPEFLDGAEVAEVE